MTNPVSKAAHAVGKVVDKGFDKTLGYIVGKVPEGSSNGHHKCVHVGDFYVKEGDSVKEVNLYYRSGR